MAPHSSTLAWKIPWMEEPGRLQSMASLRVGHNWATSFSLFAFHFHALEKEMATHSSVLAWRIPGMGEPGGLPSMGSHRVRHDWSDLATAAARLNPRNVDHGGLGTAHWRVSVLHGFMFCPYPRMFPGIPHPPLEASNATSFSGYLQWAVLRLHCSAPTRECSRASLTHPLKLAMQQVSLGTYSGRSWSPRISEETKERPVLLLPCDPHSCGVRPLVTSNLCCSSSYSDLPAVA